MSYKWVIKYLCDNHTCPANRFTADQSGQWPTACLKLWTCFSYGAILSASPHTIDHEMNWLENTAEAHRQALVWF